MENFSFYTPTRYIFGRGEEKNVGAYLKEYGAHKVLLLHYGSDMPHEVKLIDSIITSLDAADIGYVDFTGIQANPTYERAVEGTAIVRREGIDFLLAVGGGSVIDTAKFLSLIHISEPTRRS